MRVLIFTQYFPPEVGATQTRLHSVATGLAERGHEVKVLCEVPNHPQGVVHPGYRRRVAVRMTTDGVSVVHLWVKTQASKTTRSRLEFYASFAAMAAIAGFLSRRPDVVLASSPPLPVAAAAAIVAGRHRVPWVFDVRDLWPEAAIAMGELSNARVLKATERLANRLYENAAAVTTVTEPFRASIADRVSQPGKVSLVPNGTTPLWVEGADLEVDRASLGLPPGRFLWTFAGNIGGAQGLDAAVDAAGLLAGEGFRLLILGDGPAKSELQKRAASAAAAEVEFRPQVRPEEALRYLRASDALLVSLDANPLLASFVPSKLFDFCAAGRPVVVAAAGEPARLATEAGAALAVRPGDPSALANALRELRENSGRREALATRGRAFGAANLRERHIARLERVLSDCVEGLAQ